MPGELFQGLTLLTIRKFFPLSNLIVPSCNLNILFFFLLSGDLENRQFCSSLQQPFNCFKPQPSSPGCLCHVLGHLQDLFWSWEIRCLLEQPVVHFWDSLRTDPVNQSSIQHVSTKPGFSTYTHPVGRCTLFSSHCNFLSTVCPPFCHCEENNKYDRWQSTHSSHLGQAEKACPLKKYGNFSPKVGPLGGRRSSPWGRVAQATLGWGEKGHERKEKDCENILSCWQGCGRAATAVSLQWEECDRQTLCRSCEVSALVCAKSMGQVLSQALLQRA